jgi:hypothetical protein
MLQGPGNLRDESSELCAKNLDMWTALVVRKRFGASPELSRARVLLHAIFGIAVSAGFRHVLVGALLFCVLGSDRVDLLPNCSARKGSRRCRAPPGCRRVSTACTTELALMARANAYVSLTKPDVSFLVLMTTAAGYYMGARGLVDWLHMMHTVFATMLIAAGTAALNHYIERESDRHMRRTGLRAACCSLAMLCGSASCCP